MAGRSGSMTMRQISLGRTGLQVSEMIFGGAGSNTKATQLREPTKINTPITRGEQHSPAHGGTDAKISGAGQLPACCTSCRGFLVIAASVPLPARVRLAASTSRR
jgi:hypothetical protein